MSYVKGARKDAADFRFGAEGNDGELAKMLRVCSSTKKDIDNEDYYDNVKTLTTSCFITRPKEQTIISLSTLK